MAPIRIKVEGSLEQALRQFKKRCADSGLFLEIKRLAHYEKPSAERRRAERQREKNIRKFAGSPKNQLRRPAPPKKFRRSGSRQPKYS